MEKIIEIIYNFWDVLTVMSPYLLLGFFIAGLLSVIVKSETVERHLGGKGNISSIIKATLLGIPLPLCSCGVIPVAASLRKSGANRAATTAFLISTPQTGVDSMAVTYSLMGGLFAIFRVVMALVSGLIGGLAVILFGEEKAKSSDYLTPPTCDEDGCGEMSGLTNTWKEKITYIFNYGFISLPQDIGKSLFVGLILAAVLTAVLPKGSGIPLFGNGLLGMLIMLVVGIPIYVCSTGSVPIVAALLLNNVITPGAALVFLMTGPATNAATITTVFKVMGRKTAIIYLTTVAITALSTGMIFDYIILPIFSNFISPITLTQNIHSGEMVEMFFMTYFKSLSAIILLAVLSFAYFRKLRGSKNNTRQINDDFIEIAQFTVNGMTCSHCVESVKRAVSKLPSVKNVAISLNNGIVEVQGNALDLKLITNQIEDLGYKVTNFENKKSTNSLKGENKMILQIKGMTCNHCVNAVKKAIAACNGVKEVEVDLQQAKAFVSGNALPEPLIIAVESLGYEASLLEI